MTSETSKIFYRYFVSCILCCGQIWKDAEIVPQGSMIRVASAASLRRSSILSVQPASANNILSQQEDVTRPFSGFRQTESSTETPAESSKAHSTLTVDDNVHIRDDNDAEFIFDDPEEGMDEISLSSESAEIVSEEPALSGEQKDNAKGKDVKSTID